MRLGLLFVKDMRHFDAAHFQEIRNQSAMTAPPDRFRAHERSWPNFVRKSANRTDSSCGEMDKAIDAFLEVFGIDVNYRSVGEKIRELQAAKNVPSQDGPRLPFS